MKKILSLILFITGRVLAHDHVEVGLNPTNSSQLGLEGPSVQLALYLPKGEVLSGYTPAFPGGCFASELTFTTETAVLDPAVGADPEAEILSVTGPAGGWFSFWEVGAASPTWSRPSGWSQTGTNRSSFGVIFAGDAHAHGRVFSADRPGDYQVTFRARDRNNRFQVSRSHIITFRAQAPPRLSLRLQSNQAVLTFPGRAGLAYDLQMNTNPASTHWTTLVTQDGSGQTNQAAIPMTYSRAFFRLIEFK